MLANQSVQQIGMVDRVQDEGRGDVCQWGAGVAGVFADGFAQGGGDEDGRQVCVGVAAPEAREADQPVAEDPGAARGACGGAECGEHRFDVHGTYICIYLRLRGLRRDETSISRAENPQNRCII